MCLRFRSSGVEELELLTDTKEHEQEATPMHNVIGVSPVKERVFVLSTVILLRVGRAVFITSRNKERLRNTSGSLRKNSFINLSVDVPATHDHADLLIAKPIRIFEDGTERQRTRRFAL